MTAFDDAAGRVAEGADPGAEAAALVTAMTLEEKLGCLDGDMPFWPGLADLTAGGYHEHPWPAAHVKRLGIPGIDFADGPRGCVIGPATCFPVSMARGASFDPGLEQRIGQAVGAELRASGATFTGAVCMNLLRHPAWGRAQETYGEDPYQVGEMAAAFTRGLQDHVMACMKHFAVNSMENARFKVDVSADERALHEVYLAHFKRVADEGVAATMSSYNSLNGHWCGQNHALLTEVLREDWGWDGFVITDFIAGLRDPVASVQAGCNIEMPLRQQRAAALPEAVTAGELDVVDVEARVTETVATLLRFARVYQNAPDRSVIGCAGHRALAREAASESMVLLRNDGTLPLDAGGLSTVAVVGPLAAVPNLGDAGSSNVPETPDPVTLLAGLEAALDGVAVVHSDRDASIAADADVAVVVVGYTKEDEGEFMGGDPEDSPFMQLVPPMDHPELGFADPAEAESYMNRLAGGDQGSMGDAGAEESVWAMGGDRDSLRLPPADEELIAAVRAVNENVVVAVMAGSAVVVPWLESVSAALMVWYPGSEGGHALADILLGKAEPGGRLPFAVPCDEADLVAFDKDATEFTYGLLHGQWHLDANGVAPHLPFGHGLGYTEFEVGDAHQEGGQVVASVANTGSRAGSTVVQVYGAVPGSAYERAPKRLVGFAKATLEAGEKAEIAVPVNRSVLDVREDGAWLTEERPVQLYVGLDANSVQAI